MNTIINKLVIILMISFSQQVLSESIWGKDYFPNTTLTSHNGEKYQFYEDLVKDKIVVINFIYTTCPDVCPLETAQLTRVQRILGDRLGKDVFFYSISIDPETDTPEKLKEYRSRFGANWLFFTGDESEIITIRRKLGLFIEDIGGSENNHNVNMIIGNQKTGRWMKRSPFENPYVLADQIGNWLDGWKSPQQVKDYAKAPEINNFSDGENLFRTRCMSCHTIDGSTDQSIGPDLLNVTKNRDRKWLIRWLKEPDVMIKEKDPIAIALYNKYNQVTMPNFSLTEVDVMDLLTYLDDKSTQTTTQSAKKSQSQLNHEDVVAVMNAWVRQAIMGSTINAGYMTLININDADVELVKIESSLFEKVEIHSMSMRDGSMKMQQLMSLVIAANDNEKLKPGGNHLMLINPRQDLIKGDQVDLKLTFADGRSQNLNLNVLDK
jgi:protein SCO1/2